MKPIVQISVGLALATTSAFATIEAREPMRWTLSTDGAPRLGAKKAPIQVVVAIDLECPYSNDAIANTVPAIEALYPGKVEFHIKHSALPNRKMGDKASVAALCAHKQGYYWEYRNALSNLIWPATGPGAQRSRLLRNEPGPEVLVPIAESLKEIEIKDDSGVKLPSLSVADFGKCLADQKTLEQVQLEHIQVESADGNGTPTFWINGLAITGNRAEEIKKLVRQEAKRLGVK